MNYPSAKCGICRNYDDAAQGCTIKRYAHMTGKDKVCPGLDVDMSFLGEMLQDMQEELGNLKEAEQNGKTERDGIKANSTKAQQTSFTNDPRLLTDLKNRFFMANSKCIALDHSSGCDRKLMERIYTAREKLEALGFSISTDNDGYSTMMTIGIKQNEST